MKYITIKESARNIEYWLNQPYVSMELRNSMENADIVLVPRKHDDVLAFPTGTSEFNQYLREKTKNEQLTIEICIQDENYQEIALHSDVVRIAEMIVTLAIAPLITSIIANYIYDILGNRRAKKALVELSLTIRSSEKSKSIKLDYKGPTETYEKTMLEAIDKLISESPHSGNDNQPDE